GAVGGAGVGVQSGATISQARLGSLDRHTPSGGLMKSTVLIVSLACALPYAAGAQQSVQAQGSASAQGDASVERKDGGQMPSQATATGSGSAAVSSQRKADKPDKPDKGGKTGTPDKADKTANIDSGST